MNRPARAGLALLLAFAFSVPSACSVVRQRVSVTVPGDLPAVDERGRRLTGAQKKALADSLSVRIVAFYRCTGAAAGESSVATCRELDARADREVVGGTLGALASALPGVDCFDVCSTRVELDSIVRRLGRPPTPREYADRMAAGRSARTREEVRIAHRDAVRSRYRLYAAYVAEQLRDAEAVEITEPGSGAAPRRYGRAKIPRGLADAFGRVGDRYAALEWQRFAGGAPAASPARARRADPPAVPQPEPSPAPAPSPTPDRSRELCRRSCLLDQRACLARCRNEPIEGGAYDACVYECTARHTQCRRNCDTD